MAHVHQNIKSRGLQQQPGAIFGIKLPAIYLGSSAGQAVKPQTASTSL